MMKRNFTMDPTTLALQALAATLSDERRAQRLLDLTGLEAGELRARAAEPDMLLATLEFLKSHEPDLLAVADDIGARPEELVAASYALGAR